MSNKWPEGYTYSQKFVCIDNHVFVGDLVVAGYGDVVIIDDFKAAGNEHHNVFICTVHGNGVEYNVQIPIDVLKKSFVSSVDYENDYQERRSNRLKELVEPAMPATPEGVDIKREICVVEATSKNAFVSEVNKRLDSGWYLKGSMIFATGPNLYMQQMHKGPQFD